jgi:hypothetical protein
VIGLKPHLVDVDLGKGNLNAVDLVEIEHKVNEVLELLVAAFRRQGREAFEQTVVQPDLG